MLLMIGEIGAGEGNRTLVFIRSSDSGLEVAAEEAGERNALA